VKSDCTKTVSPAGNAVWKFMVNRGRDFFPKIEHVAIGRKPGGGLTMFARTLLLLNGRNGSAGIAASARAFESSPVKGMGSACRIECDLTGSGPGACQTG